MSVHITGGGGGGGSGGFVSPTQQIFLTGSGIYTKPANAVFLTIEMVGGGAGGEGSGTTGGISGTAGTDSTFGSSLLNAGGGAIGIAAQGGLGGTSSLGSATGIALTGGNGQGEQFDSTAAVSLMGGMGGGSALGGAGGGSVAANAANAAPNTGGGGAGAGRTAIANAYSGAGGGAGGYILAEIASPLATYAYTVGTGGTGGAAGASGYTGGNGGSGIIIVTEYYANGAIGTATNVTGIVAVANGGTGQSTPPVSVILVNPTSPITVFYTAITGWTILEDPTGSFNNSTGIFTPPHAGLFGFDIALLEQSSTSTGNNFFQVQLYNVISTDQRRGQTRIAAGLNVENVTLPATMRLAFGDSVQVSVSTDLTSPSFLAGYCSMSIWEIR
jgi:hypothetical protein